MKRLLSLLLVLALALGIGTAAYAQGDVTVVKLLAAAHTGEVHQALAEQFNAAHDNIKIEVDASASGWDGVSTKLITMLAGGEDVDIATVSTSYYPQFAALGQLLDITQHAEAAYPEDEYYASVFDGLMYEGKLYGVPISIYTLINYYNKDLYDAKGAAYPSTAWGKDAWTFEDWKKTAYDMSEGEGLDRTFGAWIEYQLERTACFMFPDNMNYWGEDYYPQFDNADIRALHEDLYTMLHTDLVIPDASMVDTTGLAQLFADGKVANFITGTWDHATIYSSGVNFGASATPGGTTVGYVDVYIPLNSTKHPEATLAVLDYLIGYDACMYKYENNELGPQVNKKATEDSKEKCFAGLTEEERDCIFASLDNCVPLTVFPKWAEFLSDSLLPISSLMEYGEYTVDEGFDELQQQALTLLGF
jgi:multiple sugar transport system substrate-binding protein